jgi:hypothetical protein
LDWERKQLKPLKKTTKLKQKELASEPVEFGLNLPQANENKFLKILPDNTQTNIKSQLPNELCLGMVTQEAFATAAFLPKIRPHLINYPK